MLETKNKAPEACPDGYEEEQLSLSVDSKLALEQVPELDQRMKPCAQHCHGAWGSLLLLNRGRWQRTSALLHPHGRGHPIRAIRVAPRAILHHCRVCDANISKSANNFTTTLQLLLSLEIRPSKDLVTTIPAHPQCK